MLVIRSGLLGGNPATDKHRIVPPFLFDYEKKQTSISAHYTYEHDWN